MANLNALDSINLISYSSQTFAVIFGLDNRNLFIQIGISLIKC